VPSLTDAAFALGVGDRVVGRTEFCVRPRGDVERVEQVGGTKNPDVEHVRALAPDVILANREENTKHRVEALAEDFPVWLTDPRGPDDVPDLWRELGHITARDGDAFARACEEELAAARAAAPERRPTFLYYVWKGPWIVAGHDTYISALLEAAGWRNALPAEKTRFPRLGSEDIAVLGCDLHMLSSEPYAFKIAEAPAQPARLVDGEVLSWYPSLTVEGLRYARKLLEETA